MSVVSSPASGTLWLLSKEQWAWTLFDAGCWGYASVTINTLVPLVFKQDAPEDERKYVSAIWANLVAAGTLLAGIICPFFGAILDMYGWRKIAVFLTSVAMCVCLSIFASVSGEERTHVTWLLMAIAVIGVMFYSTMQAVYNSLIVHVSEQSEDELTWLSAVQCAIGNGGAMILMMSLGIQDAKHSQKTLDLQYVQHCFLISAGWFLVFAAPLYVVYKEEPPRDSVKGRAFSLASSVRTSVVSFKVSLQNHELVKYMLATLIYSDASSTLFSVYIVFGSQVGISNTVLMQCAVVNRWLGLMMGFGWYYVGKYIGAKRAFLVAMAMTLFSAVMCAMIRDDMGFMVVNFMLAAAGSGGYIYSRVLMARLTTKGNTAQHFGLMAGVSRVSGIIGPVIYGWVVFVSGPRTGLCALAVLSVPGIWLMSGVDFDAGRQCAESVPIEDGSGPEDLE
eukprot:Tamp_15000.p1 GENE.Tamp_15000~~Tamp_15000.p1  ORF type:complete len:468 (-),score=88.51 Tamp_15000:177-1523(-)